MKKSKTIPNTLKEQLEKYLEDSYIAVPTNYDFGRDSAISFLHQSVTEIRNNYVQIAFSLASTLGFGIKELEAWLLRFNSFVESEQENIHNIKNSYSFTSITCESVAYFNGFINRANGFVSELATICSSKFERIKYNPEEGAVFIVHGHDEKLKKSLKKGLQRNGFKAIILSDMDDTGISLFKKFLAAHKMHINKV